MYAVRWKFHKYYIALMSLAYCPEQNEELVHVANDSTSQRKNPRFIYISVSHRSKSNLYVTPVIPIQ